MSRKKLAGLVAAAVVVAAAVALVVIPQVREGGGDAVAVVHLSGPIQGSVGSLLGARAITPQAVRARFEQARNNPRIKAVVLRLDTPGGTVAASQELARLVADFPEPVVVSMGDVAASGGYYMAVSADRIVAQPGTLTGSIGVIWTVVDPQGLLNKLGVKVEAVTAGKHKDMLLPGRLTPESRRIIQQITDQLYGQFVDAVVEGRRLPRSRIRELATGRLFTGQRARTLGLVDTLGGLDQAVDEAEELADIDDAAVVDLEPSFFEQLFGGPGARSLMDRIRGGEVVDPQLRLLRQLLNGSLVTPRYQIR